MVALGALHLVYLFNAIVVEASVTLNESISGLPSVHVDQRRSVPRSLVYQIREELPSGTVVVDDLIGDAGLGVSSSGSLAQTSTTSTTPYPDQQQQRSVVGSKRSSTPVRLVFLGERHLGQGQGQARNFGLDDSGRRLITIADRLDRDVECPGLVRCTIEVDLMAMQPSNNVQVISFMSTEIAILAGPPSARGRLAFDKHQSYIILGVAWVRLTEIH
jgi:hypothetical protein